MNERVATEKGYRIERLSPALLADVKMLYMAVYQRKLADDYLFRKYDTACTGCQHIGYVAYDSNDSPAAFYGVIPCFIGHNGAEILAAQSADTMTHPAHRNKGLFLKLANLTFGLCIREGIRLIFGFPNQHSEHGLVRLGWEKISHLERFTIRVKTFPLEKICSKNRWLEKLYRLYVYRMLKRHLIPLSELGKLSESQAGFSIFRDENYMSYKTYHETFLIRVGGILVWFKVKNGLVVGDVIGSTEYFDQVLDQLKALAWKLGIDQISFQLSPESTVFGLLSEGVEPVISFPMMVKDLGSGVDLSRFRLVFADIDIF